MRCYRPKEGDPNGPLEWRPLRRGIADLHRRAQLSQDSNERYPDALAACDTSTPLGRLLARVSQKTQWNGSTLRALRPWDALDARLLAAISRGEFHLRGFRNRELRALLFPKTSDDPLETRRLSGRVTRLIRILRAHRLVKKFPKLFATDSQSAVSNFAPHYLLQTLSPSINSTLLPHDFSSSQNKLFRVNSTEKAKARASEEHSAGSIDASVFDAASSVISADDDVVSSLEDLVAPGGNGKCFRISVLLTRKSFYFLQEFERLRPDPQEGKSVRRGTAAKNWDGAH